METLLDMGVAEKAAIEKLIKLGSYWGFETPNFTIRFALLAESDGNYDPKKNAWLINHATNIARNERFSDNAEKALRNQERWESLRQMFFGKETPTYWNSLQEDK